MAIDGCTSDVCYPVTGYLDCNKSWIKKKNGNLINGGMLICVTD